MVGDVTLRRLNWVYDNFEEIASALALLSMVGLLAIQVISRYVFRASVPWTEELARFAFLFLVYLSASLAAKYGRHIRITAHLKFFPVRVQNATIMLGDIVTVAFCMIVVYWGTVLFLGMAAQPLRSATLGWEVRWVFLLIPVAFAMQIVRIVERYYRFFSGREGDRLLISVEDEELERVHADNPQVVQESVTRPKRKPRDAS